MSRKERVKTWTTGHKAVLILGIALVLTILYFVYPPFTAAAQNLWARTKLAFSGLITTLTAHPFVQTYIIGLPWVILWGITIGVVIGLYLAKADIWWKRRGYQSTVQDLTGNVGYQPVHSSAEPPPAAPQPKKPEPEQQAAQ